MKSLLLVLALMASAAAQTIAPTGTPVPQKSEQIAGSDGTLLRTIKVDTTGAVATTSGTGASANQVQGNTAAGSAATGNPVSVQGTDANATATTADPVLIGGFDGTNGHTRRACVYNSQVDRNSYPSSTCYNLFGLWAGTTLWDRPADASLTNLATAVTTTARNSTGAALGEFGSRFTINSAPAAGSQATASIAAEASVRHVATGLCFSSGSTTAPVLTSLQVNLRDGATGAGTVLMTFEVEIPATTGVDTAPFCTQFTGGIVGTTNTAMTVEWSASLANLKQTATLIGYNVN